MKKLIYVCSPLRGDLEKNMKRARIYSKYVVDQGYIPFTPHIFFTQFLNDEIQEDRDAGISMGMQMLLLCQELWVFGDKISQGMQSEIDYANKNGIDVIYMMEQ